MSEFETDYPTSGTAYILVNKKSGTVLDLSDDDGISVSGWSGHGGDNQKWEAIYSHDLSNPVWNLKSVSNGRFLGVEEDPRDGLNVSGLDWAYQWVIEPEGDGYFRIMVPNSDDQFSVDLTDWGNSDDGTQVQIWGRHDDDGDNQVWRFEQA